MNSTMSPIALQAGACVHQLDRVEHRRRRRRTVAGPLGRRHPPGTAGTYQLQREATARDCQRLSLQWLRAL